MGVKICHTFIIILVCICNVLLIFDTVWLLTSFLSYRPLRTPKYSACQESFVDFTSSNIGITALLKDGLWLLLFILQHTVMAHLNVQGFLELIGFGVLARSIYVFATCACLQALMHFWQPVNSVCLWNFPNDGLMYSIIWNSMFLVHVICWFVIYGGCLIVDIGELIGLKQVRHYYLGFPDPLKDKSEDLRRYYKHMRHPSFIGFSLILWFIPQMSLDRVLLALQLPLYMYMAWHTDAMDIKYIQSQLADKEKSSTNGEWHRRHYIRKHID